MSYESVNQKLKASVPWPVWRAIAIFTVCIWAVIAVIAISHVTADSPRKPFVVDDALQAKRKAFIAECVQRGVISKVDGISSYSCSLWIEPAFYSLPFEHKESMCGAIYSYYFPNREEGGVMNLLDGQTGKTIGSYGAGFSGTSLSLK